MCLLHSYPNLTDTACALHVCNEERAVYIQLFDPNRRHMYGENSKKQHSFPMLWLDFYSVLVHVLLFDWCY